MGKLTFRRRKKAALPQMPPPPPAIEIASTSKAAVKKKAGGGAVVDEDGSLGAVGTDRVRQERYYQAVLWARVGRVLLGFAVSDSVLGFMHAIAGICCAWLEKAMIVNLEFIRAIVTAEEVLLLDPLRQEWLPVPEAAEVLQDELPFEFQVLEIALEVVCTYLDSSVAELERDAYPALDELAVNVSTKNLEHVRSLKSNLTRLLARVQKVRDEIEHLLDDNEDMGQLYLTRKWIQNQQSEALPTGPASNSIVPTAGHLRRLSSTRSGSLLSNYFNDDDVEDLEMLLEAYFMQLDGTRNKILSVREYIDDTEDYVNIQLDNQRNELIQLQLTLTIASFAVAVETLIAGIFGMNIPCTLYNINGIFWRVVGLMTAACIALFILVLGYARWKKLIGS
ncbi:Magnesium transporter MRS2-4 [Sesamum angolense]|uniref:Magnesium transporter n=1 Tax=Sesamum angolense TaxID=2727404 RepID=A0AAE2C0Z8_9LAMI|nr:Magnesium transporter MRS2-4 [Sesamum angolense]